MPASSGTGGGRSPCSTEEASRNPRASATRSCSGSTRGWSASSSAEGQLRPHRCLGTPLVSPARGEVVHDAQSPSILGAVQSGLRTESNAMIRDLDPDAARKRLDLHLDPFPLTP